MKAFAGALLVLAISLPAFANRLFVSGTGVDTGACPVTAPCRSFSYAMTQVAGSGEIIALDTAGYGTVSITLPVSIVAAPGATAFVAASAGDAVDVSTSINQTVTLRGLALTGTGATVGINFLSGSYLNIENCVISGFSSYGILFSRTGDTSAPEVRVINTMIRSNTNGLYILNIGAGTPGAGPPTNLSFATISNSQIIGGVNVGLLGGDNSRIAVSDTVVAGNLSIGVEAFANADSSYGDVNLDRCTISHNGTGVFGGDATATQNLHGIVRLANCMITGNATGIASALDGQTLTRIPAGGVLEFSNTIAGNTTLDGSPSGTFSAR